MLPLVGECSPLPAQCRVWQSHLLVDCPVLSQQDYPPREVEGSQTIYLFTAQAVINDPAHLLVAKGFLVCLFLKKIIVSTHSFLIILLPFRGCETGM